jgi:hypothetical protein
MYFLIELAKVIRNCSEKEFSQYVGSLGYFTEKNKTLGKKWTEYLEDNKEVKDEDKGKEWHRTIREIRNWEDQELDYMYQRIMALSRQIFGNNTKYFTVETFSGQLTIPDRMQILNRLVAFSDELLSRIYPRIIRLLNYKIDNEEINSTNIRGTINWNNSIQYALKNSGGNLISFVCNIPTRSFETDENMLLLLSMKILHNDANQILDFQKKEYVSTEDKKIVWDVTNKTKKILNEPFLKKIDKNNLKNKNTHKTQIEIKKIIEEIEKNISIRKSKQKEYQKLIVWLKKYIDFNVNRYQNLSNFTLHNLKDIDTMFELWILFEFVTHVKKKYHAIVSPITEMKGKRKLKGFRIKIDGNEFNLMYDQTYQKVPVGAGGFEHRGNTIQPDFTFEFGDNCVCGHSPESHNKSKSKYFECEWGDEHEEKCSCDHFRKHIPIILDAKNWRNQNRMEAVRISSWYLMNMNKNKAKTGIMLFSNYDGKDSSNPMTHHWGPVKINQGEWEFINYVVKSSKKNEFKDQLEQVFEAIMTKFPPGIIQR